MPIIQQQPHTQRDTADTRERFFPGRVNQSESGPPSPRCPPPGSTLSKASAHPPWRGGFAFCWSQFWCGIELSTGRNRGTGTYRHARRLGAAKYRPPITHLPGMVFGALGPLRPRAEVLFGAPGMGIDLEVKVLS